MLLLTPFELLNTPEAPEKLVPISIQIRRNVKHFSSLSAVSEGFQSIDGLLRTELEIHELSVLNSSLIDEARAKLHRFRVNSDPVAEITANYPWLSLLAVAVVLIRDYQKFKDSSKAILADATAFVEGFKGFSQQQKKRVIVGVALLLDELLKLPEESLRAWADKLNRVRRSLTGVEGELPSVEINPTQNAPP